MEAFCFGVGVSWNELGAKKKTKTQKSAPKRQETSAEPPQTPKKILQCFGKKFAQAGELDSFSAPSVVLDFGTKREKEQKFI